MSDHYQQDCLKESAKSNLPINVQKDPKVTIVITKT